MLSHVNQELDDFLRFLPVAADTDSSVLPDGLLSGEALPGKIWGPWGCGGGVSFELRGVEADMSPFIGLRAPFLVLEPLRWDRSIGETEGTEAVIC